MVENDLHCRVLTPAECREEVLVMIDEELERLQQFQRLQTALQGERNRVELLRSGVPEGAGLERLLRYGA